MRDSIAVGLVDGLDGTRASRRCTGAAVFAVRVVACVVDLRGLGSGRAAKGCTSWFSLLTGASYRCTGAEASMCTGAGMEPEVSTSVVMVSIPTSS